MLLGNQGEVKSSSLLGAMGIGRKVQFSTAFRLGQLEVLQHIV